MDVVSRPGLGIFFIFMLTTSNPADYSKKSLEGCTELIADLVEGAADLKKSFLYLEETAKKRRCPLNGQRMSELKDMMTVFQRQLMLEKTELEFLLAQKEDQEEVEAALKEHAEKRANANRRAQS